MGRASRALAASAFALALASPAFASAGEAAPGAGALKQARAAWDKSSYEQAEPLYREALEKGGLAPNEVLEGYVRLGAIRASMGKKEQAIAAFRAASILDASFAVPVEGGPRAPGLAERAKNDTKKIGAIRVSMQAPKETPAGKSFHVVAQVDAAHVPIVAKMGLVARDGTSGKETTLDAKTEESVDFEVPADITLPNASLVVRVDALDKNGNRLASAEERVKVPDSGPVAAAGAGLGAGAVSSSSTSKPPGSDDGLRKGGGFWSTPWPYVIGGVALAGVGAAVYFGTRPSADVSVGQVGVQTR